jgi:hypothetical protein
MISHVTYLAVGLVTGLRVGWEAGLGEDWAAAVEVGWGVDWVGGLVVGWAVVVGAAEVTVAEEVGKGVSLRTIMCTHTDILEAGPYICAGVGWS